jgi:hypothetical protein
LNSEDDLHSLTMFYTMLKTEFYYLLLMFDEIAIFFYHNLIDIFLTIGLAYTLNPGYEFVCTICTNILKMTLTARMSLKTTIA